MDLKDLSNAQMILLVMLVTFVISIGTSIVSVALLADAPPSVPQTVNTIIERTVQTIASSTGVSIPKETIKETTVIVRDDSEVPAAIAAAFAQLVAIHSSDATSSPIVGAGIRVGDFILTDASLVGDGTHLVAVGEQVATATRSKVIADLGIAVLTPTTKIGSPAKIADTASLKLGQTLIALPKVTEARISLGSLVAVGDVGTTERARTLEVSGGGVRKSAVLVTSTGAFAGLATLASMGESGASIYVSLSDAAGILTTRTTATSTAP